MGGARGGFGEGASVFGGLTPFIFPIPSMVTVFPSGVLSAFSFFFFPIKGRLAHDVRKRQKAKDVTDRLIIFFLSRTMNAPYCLAYPSSHKGRRLGGEGKVGWCYITNFRRDVKT